MRPITCADLDFRHLGLADARPTYRRVPRFRRTLIRAWMHQIGDRCLFCDRPFDLRGGPEEWKDRRPTIDHIDARALGGADVLENLQVICLWCNHLKAIAEHETLRSLKETL